MDHIYESDAVDTAPELTSLKSKGYPTNGNPSLAIPATQPGAGWFYMIKMAIVNTSFSIIDLKKDFELLKFFSTGVSDYFVTFIYFSILYKLVKS